MGVAKAWLRTTDCQGIPPTDSTSMPGNNEKANLIHPVSVTEFNLGLGPLKEYTLASISLDTYLPLTQIFFS